MGVIESVQITPHDLTVINSPIDLSSKYPNSTHGNIQIPGSEEVGLLVFNLQGVKVFDKPRVQPDSNVDLSKLNKGTYLIKFKTAQRSSIQRIIIR